MKDLKQIKSVIMALEKDRERRLGEILRINAYIKKKMDMVTKMENYQKDYESGQQFDVTKSIPTLHKNLNAFINKIRTIIKAEEVEIEKLNQHKKVKLDELQKLDQKIQMIEHFKETAKQEKIMKSEVSEQLVLDDLSSIKHSRGDNE